MPISRIKTTGVELENLEIAGSEAFRAPVGTTAQREGSPKSGDQRFNSTVSVMEYYDGTAWRPIETSPAITSIDTTVVDSQAGGNQTIVINGSAFKSGAIVTFVGQTANFNASSTVVNNETKITATVAKLSFLNAQEPYSVKVTNPSGASGLIVDQINVDTAPAWTTASGSLGTIFSNDTGTHFTVAATDADGDTVSYSETASVLSGRNLTINSSTGAISGDPTDVSADDTVSFTLRATASVGSTDRNFSFILRPPNYQNIVDVFGDGSGIAYYKLESDGTDESGNYNATVGTANSFTSGGKFNNYASTSSGSNVGQNVYVSGSTLADLLSPSVTWSYSKWFAPTSGSSHTTINGTITWWYIYTDYGGSATAVRVAHYNTGSTTNVVAQGNYTNNGGTWQHLCVTNNPNGNLTVYVNGAQIAQTSGTTSTAAYNSGAYRTDITPAEGGTSGSGTDHVRIFNRELTSAEVTTLYNEIS
jgi:hypothetical protein